MSWNPLPREGSALPKESLKDGGINGFGYSYTYEELVEEARSKTQH